MLPEVKKYGKLRNFINGKFQESSSSEVRNVINPATLEKIAEVPLSIREEVELTIREAERAFEKWKEVPITERIKYIARMRELLLKHSEEISRIITQEHGKVIHEARKEVKRAIENIEAAIASVYHMMGRNNMDIATGVDEEYIREPLGVFVVITPFNFPAMIPFWFIPYAIVTGNTVIVKPSPRTPVTLSYIIHILSEEKLGLPPGVLNLINGGKEVVDTIIENPVVRGISFVGSTPIAKYVYGKGARYGKRVQAQASAKNFIVVMPDADLEKTIPALVGSFFGDTGQRCLAGANLIVFPENHKEVVEKFKEQARRLILGYGLDESVTMGPLNSKEAKERVVNYITRGIEEGAKLILDGRRFHVKGGWLDDCFLGASIFDNVTPDMTIAREEIFGPVASVLEAKDFDEAINLINRSDYGNAASIFTNSGKWARLFKKYVKAGNIGINIGIPAPVAWYPFGGMKDSFFGDLHGQGGDDFVYFFTERKIIITRW